MALSNVESQPPLFGKLDHQPIDNVASLHETRDASNQFPGYFCDQPSLSQST